MSAIPSARSSAQTVGFAPAAASTVTSGADAALRSVPRRMAPVDAPERFQPSESARIAVYDEAGSAPRVEEVGPASTGEYISALSSRTYELSRALGGRVPYSVINEVVENYIHADFRGPVVTILDRGNTIRFSDQGPGIKDKRRAVEPGYTTASADMKLYIRGVGSGLPLARECLSFNEGTVQIEDNLGPGTVVTVSVVSPDGPQRTASSPDSTGYSATAARVSTAGGQDGVLEGVHEGGAEASPLSPGSFSLEPTTYPAHGGTSRLTNRQKRVLALVMDAGEAGPSLVARELAIGLSTAYRDLAHLEALGFIASDETGKRSLTADGAGFLRSLLHPTR